jgi:uncharacterized protein (DUF2267 family)
MTTTMTSAAATGTAAASTVGAATTPATATTPAAATAAARGAADGPRRPEWSRLVDAVQECGQYTTRREAERITRMVLSALGGHVIGDERVELARRLPEEAARLIASQIPVTRPLTAHEFVDAVAARIEGATPATARWDVSAVLSTLPAFVGDGLTTRLIRQLPSGYALLFGKAELAPAV